MFRYTFELYAYEKERNLCNSHATDKRIIYTYLLFW
jgi:hypothetical protein